MISRSELDSGNSIMKISLLGERRLNPEAWLLGFRRGAEKPPQIIGGALVVISGVMNRVNYT